MNSHRHPTGYVRGCEQCKQAKREINARRRAELGREVPGVRKAAREAFAAQVVPLKTRETAGQQAFAEPSNVEAVAAECAPYLAERPAMCQAAITLAQVLDDRSLVGLWPSSSRQLTAILSALHRTRKPKSKGRLASVRALSAVKNG